MTIPRTTAKKLSTDVEFRLVDESFAPAIGELSEKGLAARIVRARRARDKYRTLSERQNRESRARVAPRSTRASASNQNTLKKQQMFDETLARYEKRAAQLGSTATADGSPTRKAGASNAARKASAKPASVAKGGTTAKKPAKKAQAAQADGGSKRKSAARAAKKSKSKQDDTTAIPSLQRLVRKVAKAAAEMKDEAVDAAKSATTRSSKAPAKADGASTRRTRTKATVNPKGPEYQRNPHEHGRVSSVQRRQQARRDSR